MSRLTPYLEHPQVSYKLKEKRFLMPCFFLKEHQSARQIYVHIFSFFLKKVPARLLHLIMPFTGNQYMYVCGEMYILLEALDDLLHVSDRLVKSLVGSYLTVSINPP